MKRILASLAFLSFAGAYISSDEQKAVKVWELKSIKEGKTVVIAGKTFGPYLDEPQIKSTVDGTKFVLVGKVNDQKVSIVFNGKEVGIYDFPMQWLSLTIAPDGNSYAVHLFSDHESLVIVDGKTYGPFKESKETTSFSPSAKKWVFVSTNQNDEAILVINGKIMGPFATVHMLSVNGDSGPITAVVEKLDGSNSVFIDQKESGPYNWVSQFYVSKSGLHYAYQTEKKIGYSSVKLVVVDGKEYLGADNLTYFTDSKGAEFFQWYTIDGPIGSSVSQKL